MLAERHYGLGVARQQLSDDVAVNQMHYLWLSIPFYNLALILSKISALFLFIRIFRTKSLLFATYILMGFLFIAGFWMIVSGFVSCIPISDFWRAPPRVAAQHCLPQGPVWYSNAAMQIFSDVVILVIPMPWLYRLQLPQQQKIGIMLVYGVGIFAIATSSVRLYELSTMVNGRDFTKTNAAAAVCEEGGIFSNAFFYAGPGGCTASISKVGDNEKNEKGIECEGQDGIRVVRELRMVSDLVVRSPKLSPRVLATHTEKDIELGEVPASASASGSGGDSGGGTGQGTWN
ncbi:hypothetical protein N7451_012447 [Penicillium sp. IBT 35674x]|nr:hypothetical protein N7451_012447 [Penicillium sp. IBT 35674x]